MAKKSRASARVERAKPARIPNPKPAAKGLPKADFSQISSTGLERSDGLVLDESIRELQGIRAFRHYREIADNSAVAGACLLAIEMLIRKVQWKVVPGDESAEETERAEFIEQAQHDMSVSWEDTVSEILSMIVYGFNYSEIVYKIRKGPDESNPRHRSRYTDGKIAWRKLVSVPPESLSRWEFDNEGGLRGMWQNAEGDYKERFVPIEKSLLFRVRHTKNNPQGRSMLRNAYFAWQFAKRAMELEGIGMERDLAGVPMALVPPEILDRNSTPEDAALLTSIKMLVSNVRRNAQEGIIFPMAYDDENNPLYEFKLLATGGMKQFDTGKIIERYERRIAMSLLSDVIMMGHERVGSLALSRDKTTLIGRAIAGIMQSVASVFNDYAIPRLYRLNGWETQNPTRLEPGDLENFDIKNLGAYVSNLVSVGAMTPDPGLEDELRELAGLPKIDPEYILAPEDRLLPNEIPPPEPDDDDEGDGGKTAKSDSEEETDNEEPPKRPATTAATRKPRKRKK